MSDFEMKPSIVKLLDEYRGVVEGIDPEATFQVAWEPSIVRDRWKQAKETLTLDSTPEEFLAAQEGARVDTVKVLSRRLLEAGFLGSASKLFADVVAYPDLKPKKARKVHGDIQERIDSLQRVPKSDRKRAKVIASAGYYIGATYHPFND